MAPFDDPLANRIGMVLLIAICIAVYFLPSLVAGGRHHRNAFGILCLNLLLGWTLLGWAVALIWAVYREKPDPRAYENAEAANPFNSRRRP